MQFAEIGRTLRERLDFRGVSMPAPGGRVVWRVVIAALVILALYFPIGMIWIHEISDDPDFTAGEAFQIDGGSHSVAIAAALVDREINHNRWTANDPFFLPSAALDNMPNFQQGIVSAVARFSFELTDQIGRTRGSSQTDPDLQEAAGLLQYSGKKWIWDPSVSLMPTAASEKQYQKAVTSLQNYNRRLVAGDAVFERRGDNLMATLDRIALDLGSSSAVLDKHIIENSGGWLDFQADDLFYGIKGQTYAYYVILRGLGEDFASVIKERQLGNAWGLMLESMHQSADLSPVVVVNGRPDGGMMPSHLAAQGFFLLRARTQLREITNILLK